MKKFFATIIAVMTVASMFTGCGAAALKDGTYKAKMSEESHGWIDYVEVTVSDGKISAVDFDSLNDAGDKKSENQEYEDSMVPVSGIGPMTFFKQYEDDLLAKQDISKVETIAGATGSGINFKQMVKELQKNMEKGDTTELIVTAPKEDK